MERMIRMEKIKEQFNQVLPYFMVTLMFYYGGPLFMINDEISIFIMGIILPIASILLKTRNTPIGRNIPIPMIFNHDWRENLIKRTSFLHNFPTAVPIDK